MSAPMLTASDLSAARVTWAAHYATADGYRFMPAEELVRFCGRRRGTLGRVLEVGCGSGANLWYLAEHSVELVGIDFCERALRVAREVCANRARPWPGAQPPALAMASLYDLPFADGAFDAIIDVMVSQHVAWEEHRTIFAEYRRLLTPGGVLFLYHLAAGTTGTSSGGWDHPNGIPLFPAAGHLCLPPTEALARRLRESGFEPTDVRGLDRTYPDRAHAVYAVIEGTAI